MNGPNGKKPSSLVQFLLIATFFFLPLVIASWLYYGDSSWLPEGRTNHGAILEPIVNLRDTLPNSRAAGLSENHWLLIYPNEGECRSLCREALHRMRQSRLMLGRDMDRVRRVFLHGDSPPDRVFLDREHRGLTAIEDRALSDLLSERRPKRLSAGGFFLVDPLGNLVMYFSPDINPGDMVDDIEHLLDLSQIG